MKTIEEVLAELEPLNPSQEAIKCLLAEYIRHYLKTIEDLRAQVQALSMRAAELSGEPTDKAQEFEAPGTTGAREADCQAGRNA